MCFVQDCERFRESVWLESSLFLTVVEAKAHHEGGTGSSPVALSSLGVGLCGQGHPTGDGWSLVEVVK